MGAPGGLREGVLAWAEEKWAPWGKGDRGLRGFRVCAGGGSPGGESGKQAPPPTSANTPTEKSAQRPRGVGCATQ